MIIKNEKLEFIAESIGNVMKSDFPIDLAFRIKKIYNKIEPSYKIYRQSKIELYKKYSLKDPDGNMIDDKGEKVTNGKIYRDLTKDVDFQEEIKNLDKVEIKIDEEPILLSQLSESHLKKINIKPADLEILDFIFKE